MIIALPLEEANDNYDEVKNLVLQIFNNAVDNFEKNGENCVFVFAVL